MWLFDGQKNSAKESLSEYGSGWEWDNSPHVFDQTSTAKKWDEYGNQSIDDTPIRYNIGGTKVGYCTNDTENTYGQVLFSSSVMINQKSCRSNILNAGNYYNWSTTNAGGTNNYSSICPRGWQLSSSGMNNKDMKYMTNLVYKSISVKDAPISIIYAGYYMYNGNNTVRGDSARFWSKNGSLNSNKDLILYGDTYLCPNGYCNGGYGFSLRCVHTLSCKNS